MDADELFDSTLRRLGVDIDIRHPDAPVDGYDVIVAPCLQLMSDQRARHLAEAARRSLLILGPRTGLRDEFGRIHGDGQPGPLHPHTGCRLLNFDGLWPGMVVEVGGEEATIWAESYAVDRGQALFTS